MIYTYGSNGHYQTGIFEFDNYATAFIVVPPNMTPPRARHPIGVNQPPNGGNDYPFVRPSPDIEHLLGDLYLSYPDDTCSYAYPFRIQWMYGFGDKTVTPPAGYPTPTHDYDILIKDDNDVTVFDSTLTGTGDDSDNIAPYVTSVWYDRLVIIEWTNASKDTVCRCTKFIGWDSYSTDYQDYDEYIVPVYNAGTVTAVANVGGKTQLTITYDQSEPALQKDNVIYVKGTNVSGYNVVHTVVTVDNATTITTDITYSAGITTDGLWQHPSGILDPRTYNKLPLRLRSLKVKSLDTDLGTVLQGDIIFHSKYNIEIKDNPDDIVSGDLALDDFGITVADHIVAGTRLTNRILIDSEPGLGSGTYVSCDPKSIDVPLRRLNSAIGDDKQNIILDPGNKCIRLQRPVELTDDCPREFEFDGTAVPDPSDAPHTHRLMNDCASCCDCDYFARTYQGLKRQWFAYQQISTDAMEARDQFKVNVTRWHYQKECREDNPIIFSLQIMRGCTINVGIAFGNPSACCLVGAHMRVTFEYYDGTEWVAAAELPSKGFITNAEVQTSENDEGPESYDIVGEFPVVDITTVFVQPSAPFQFGCKVCIPECIEGSKLRFSTHIWWENELKPEHETCNFPENISPSSEIAAIWAGMDMPIPPYTIRYEKISSDKKINPDSKFATGHTH